MRDLESGMNLESAIQEINAYLRGPAAGYALLVNTENDKVYDQIRSRLSSSGTLRFFSVSDLCPADTLPNADDLCDLITGEGKFVLAGLSPLLMLHSMEAVRNQIGALLHLPVHDHAVVLLEHCGQECREQIHMDCRVSRQILFAAGERSVLPRIHVVKKREDLIVGGALTGVKSLLAWLEKPAAPEITVVTRYAVPFQNAVYSVTASSGVYETLTKVWPELRSATEKAYGTEAQWRSLAKRLQESQNLTETPSEEMELRFTNSVIELRQKDIAELTLFSNQPMEKPRMRVEIREGEWKVYEGEFAGDQKHAKFIMPELKRSKTFNAEIYDGDTKLAAHMTFRVQKRTAWENDFGLGL